MDPLLRGALAVSLLGAIARAAEPRSPPRPAHELELVNPSEPAAAQDAPCPAGTLPDGDVCVPVPDDEQGGSELSEEHNQHHDRHGVLRAYDQIPRRPERPTDFRLYHLPVTPPRDQSFVASGYDLDRPDSEQRRGAELRAVGHGGVDLAAPRGTRVALVNLENQVGDAEVLDVGHLFGNSVVTHHTLREGGRLREYLVIYGHLDSAAPGLSHGMTLAEGALLGYVGDSGSPGAVHLHFEVRRARAGVDAESLTLGQVNQNSKTVACDPRNVLELVSK
ncbi:MAG TPA: M23 family metallopeptidase [Polyangiaceae bacterium]|jgi:murein DD-endopeptidase MepM/ murein hydrolase activator NlpD